MSKKKRKKSAWKYDAYDYTGFGVERSKHNYSIELPSLLRDKIHHYCNAVKGEISGFGKVSWEKNKIIVKDIIILPQTCSVASTTLTEAGLSKFLFELIQQGRKPEEWKLWWHSHADFETFWSGTDTNTIAKISKSTNIVAICANQDGNMIGAVGEHGRYESAKIVYKPGSVRHKRMCEAEVKEFVREERVLQVDTVKRRTTLDYLRGKDMWKDKCESVKPVDADLNSSEDDSCWDAYLKEHIYGQCY